MLEGFKQFILKGNVVDLAVGIVIGASFTSVVNSFTKDLLTPIIGSVWGQGNLVNLSFALANATFAYGDFLNAAITFFLTALVLYFFVVKPMNHFMEIAQLKPTTTDAATKKCPYCFSEVQVHATRCAFCTSKLEVEEKGEEEKKK